MLVNRRMTWEQGANIAPSLLDESVGQCLNSEAGALSRGPWPNHSLQTNVVVLRNTGGYGAHDPRMFSPHLPDLFKPVIEELNIYVKVVYH